MQQNNRLHENSECTVWGEDRNPVRLGHDVNNKAAITYNHAPPAASILNKVTTNNSSKNNSEQKTNWSLEGVHTLTL